MSTQDLMSKLFNQAYAESLEDVPAAEICDRKAQRKARRAARVKRITDTEASVRSTIQSQIESARDRGIAYTGPTPNEASEDRSVSQAAEQFRREESEDESLDALVSELRRRWDEGRLPELSAEAQKLNSLRRAVAAAEAELASARKSYGGFRCPAAEQACQAAHEKVCQASAAAMRLQDSIAAKFGFCPGDSELRALDGAPPLKAA
jgi:hypothetical protein